MYIINLQTAFIAFHIMLVHSLQYMETLPYIRLSWNGKATFIKVLIYSSSNRDTITNVSIFMIVIYMHYYNMTSCVLHIYRIKILIKILILFYQTD